METKNTVELTEKEHKALVFLVSDGMRCICAEKPSELLEDNMSWFNRKSLSKGTGFSKHEAAGLMSSLEKKGMVVNDYDDDQEYNSFVTEEGIEWVHAVWEKLMEVMNK